MTSKLCHKTLREWTIRLNRSLGVQIPTQVILLSGIIVILLIQLLMYLSLSSQVIYCQIPNLRSYYQCNIPPSYEKLPTIYVITPTYSRLEQKAELTRLSHTFMLVPNLHWIIVEDSEWATNMVTQFVNRLKNEYNFHTVTRLHKPTPESFKLKPGEPSWRKPKGVWQRNKGIEWLRLNLVDLDRDGVVYFADDDNTYDLELFHEMRFTRRVSVWPVGLVGGLTVEGPIVEGSTVKEFSSRWAKNRAFPIDMAGFAVSMHQLMSRPRASFSDEQRAGFLESHFITQLADSWGDLEPKADKCTKVLVWHTKTQPTDLHQEKRQKPQYP